MRNYAEMELFSLLALARFEAAQDIVRHIPDRSDGWVRCHEVARIVQGCLNLESEAVVDGLYGDVEHSWLVLSSAAGGFYILDPYAAGRLPQVQLVDPHVPGTSALYHPCSERTDIDDVFVEQGIRIVNTALAGTKIGGEL